jgi:hypothetical protein
MIVPEGGVLCAHALMFAGWLATVSLPAWAGTDWTRVAEALGKSGTEMPGGVYRVGLPRADLKVTLDGVALKPALALGSWLAFRTTDDTTKVMGDLVLTDTEVSPVMKNLVEGGIEITALHNHLLRAQPATYLHAHSRTWRPDPACHRSARRLGLEQDAPDGAKRRGASTN